MLAGNIVIASGGASSLPAAALTFSDSSDVTIDPSAFASATANIDLQANGDITFQDPVSVRNGVALIAEANGSILVNNRLTTSGTNLTLNAGSGGISTIAAGEIASDGLVMLDTSGAIGSPGNPLQFDATTPPAAIAVGSVTQPTATYLAGLGDLNLGSVNSLLSNGTLEVTAAGNLNVLAGATLDTGSGTLSLSADTNADGTVGAGAGVLSIGPGATVISTNPTTGAITLQGADIDIDTSADPALVSAQQGGGVVICPSPGSLPMSLGGTNNGAGVNLTDAELAQIQTTASGTVTIGNSAQTGNITFTTATPATTAGASICVVQDPDGPGQIILDDGGGSCTALNGNGGSISLAAGAGGIVAASANDGAAEIATTGPTVTLNTTGPIGSSGNRIQFADNPNTSQQNVIIGSTNQPSSIFVDGLGSLTLGNVEGGPTCTQVDITARTNLVVASGATINSSEATESQPTGIIVSNSLAPESLATGWDCPSLCLLPDGNVLVVYGNWNSQLDWRISSDGGQTWGTATAFGTVTVARVQPVGCTVLSDGTILLMTDEWLDPGGDEQSICALRGTYNSAAGTIAWSSPSTVAATHASAAFTPIQLPSGRILYSCYWNNGPDVFYSDDDGTTWALLSNICNDGSFSETCLTLMPDGSIIAWIRGESDGDPSPVFTAGGTYTAISSDGGATWSAPILRIPSGGDGSSAYGDTAGPASVVRLSSGLTIVMTRCYSATDGDGYANTCAVYFTQNTQTFSGPFYPDPSWGYWYGTGIQLNGSTALFAYNANVGADVFTVIDPATLDTGTGTLSLAADTNADGTGNDGTGTLSIGAGATVISSSATANAITLRGANIEIDTGSFDMTLGSSVNGGGADGLTKIGTGSLTLSAANSYAGGTTVLAGTLLVTVAGALPDDSSLTVAAGGTFVFDPSITASNDTIASSSNTITTTALPSFVSISNAAGDSLLQSSATAATSPPALPQPSASLPQTKDARTGESTSVRFPNVLLTLRVRNHITRRVISTVIDSPVLSEFSLAGTRTAERTIWSFIAKKAAGDLAWLAQTTNSSDNSNQQRRKDVAILALDALFAQYGR